MVLLSIIIITLNEEENVENTIKSAQKAALLSSGKKIPIEIIVCDGGSEDRTIVIAKKYADKVILSPRGRYNQLNTGAKESKGDFLLFLHADTLLPSGAVLRIIHYLKTDDKNGGGFKKYWNWDTRVKRTSFVKFMSYWWEGLGNWLVQLLKSFPGDNAIFVRRSVFKELNGFSPMWLCEDFDFIKRLKKLGKEKVVYIRSPVLTSSRRFERYGFINTLLLWVLIYFLWRLGMNINRIKLLFQQYSTTPEKGNKRILRF